MASMMFGTYFGEFKLEKFGLHAGGWQDVPVSEPPVAVSALNYSASSIGDKSWDLYCGFGSPYWGQFFFFLYATFKGHGSYQRHNLVGLSATISNQSLARCRLKDGQYFGGGGSRSRRSAPVLKSKSVLATAAQSLQCHTSLWRREPLLSLIHI